MSDEAPERTCPQCGSGSVESAGVKATFYPRRLRDHSDRGRGRKVVESRFRCRECGHEFKEIVETEH